MDQLNDRQLQLSELQEIFNCELPKILMQFESEVHRETPDREHLDSGELERIWESAERIETNSNQNSERNLPTLELDRSLKTIKDSLRRTDSFLNLEEIASEIYNGHISISLHNLKNYNLLERRLRSLNEDLSKKEKKIGGYHSSEANISEKSKTSLHNYLLSGSDILLDKRDVGELIFDGSSTPFYEAWEESGRINYSKQYFVQIYSNFILIFKLLDKDPILENKYKTNEYTLMDIENTCAFVIQTQLTDTVFITPSYKCKRMVILAYNEVSLYEAIVSDVHTQKFALMDNQSKNHECPIDNVPENQNIVLGLELNEVKCHIENMDFERAGEHLTNLRRFSNRDSTPLRFIEYTEMYHRFIKNHFVKELFNGVPDASKINRMTLGLISLNEKENVMDILFERYTTHAKIQIAEIVKTGNLKIYTLNVCNVIISTIESVIELFKSNSDKISSIGHSYLLKIVKGQITLLTDIFIEKVLHTEYPLEDVLDSIKVINCFFSRLSTMGLDFRFVFLGGINNDIKKYFQDSIGKCSEEVSNIYVPGTAIKATIKTILNSREIEAHENTLFTKKVVKMLDLFFLNMNTLLSLNITDLILRLSLCITKNLSDTLLSNLNNKNRNSIMEVNFFASTYLPHLISYLSENVPPKIRNEICTEFIAIKNKLSESVRFAIPIVSNLE